MKFKRLAMLGILLTTLGCSGVVSQAEERISGEELPVEVNYTYETAPWIREDGSVNDELAHWFRIANAEKGGVEVNQFYFGARDGIKVYKTKDTSSEVVAEYGLNDFIYIHIVYEDGWAWDGFSQGYIQMADLSEEWVYDTENNVSDMSVGNEDIHDSEKGVEISVDEEKNAIEMFINGLKIVINL